MKDQNNVAIIGRLTRDPELRYTTNNRAVVSFSLANNRDYVSGGNRVEKVSFFDCVAWNKLAEIIAQHCVKGKQIAVSGELQQRRWSDSDGKGHSKVEILVSEIQMLQRKEADDSPTIPREYPSEIEEKDYSGVFDDEDAPF